jgi:hypothetical protein
MIIMQLLHYCAETGPNASYAALIEGESSSKQRQDSSLRNNSAPLHRLHLIAPPGVKKQWFAGCAKRAAANLRRGHPKSLQLELGGKANIKAVFHRVWIGLQSAALTQLLKQNRQQRRIRGGG